jgi:hypothetical protein
MAELPTYLMQRSYASTALDITKMKAFTPCDIDSWKTSFKARMTDVVFDPLRIEEVNAKFIAAGYKVPDDTSVIAITDDDTILIWGGANSVYHLRKGGEIKGGLDDLAFEEISDLTRLFKIKNKKVEIDGLIAQLKEKYTTKK